MKKTLYVSLVLLLASCTADSTDYAADMPCETGRPVTLTGFSGSATRTQFAPDGSGIVFSWSAADRIWVGDTQSTEAGIDGLSAAFGFENLTGEAPYRVCYNMTGRGSEACVPAVQYQNRPFQPQLGPNGDFGYAVTDAEGRFTLSHATSCIWLNPWSQDVDAKLISVSLVASSPELVLSGRRRFDGGVFGEATDPLNGITLSFGEEGVALPRAGSDVEVFAAAVVYPADCSQVEFYVTYTFADGSVYTETRAGRNFESGRIYRLTTEITARNGGSFAVERDEMPDGAVCLRYGAAEELPLTVDGWIPAVRIDSAPVGWTADMDIARRILRIAPPAAYVPEMDLENTLTIRSGDEVRFSQEYYVLDFTHPEGTFVLMEGNMTSENGSIVYFDQHGRYHERVYEQINANEIGNVLQDMYMANGRIYFLTQNGRTSSMGTAFNGDGRYVVCDAHTMKRLVARDMNFYAGIDTSTGATQSSKSVVCWPQHIVVVSPEKGYIQYSVSMESHSGIRVIDLRTNIIDTKDVPGTFGAFTVSGATKARMVFSRGKVFAGRGNSVIVIDPATDTVVKTHTFENRQVKDIAKGADGRIYALFTGEFETDGLGYYGNVVWKSSAKFVVLDAQGDIVQEQELPESVRLRTGTASPSVQMCASFREPYIYFISKPDFSANEAARYNYLTGKLDENYITAELDATHVGGDIIYGYMGVHPTTEQLWVGKSSYTESRIEVYDVSRSDAVEFGSFYQKKASPAGVDFAYRFSQEWIDK